MIKPASVDDSREICETLLSGRTVILNLEGLDLEIAQRIIDFISGSAFAISGNLQKISNYIFLVTPTNVDISGDLQDLLEHLLIHHQCGFKHFNEQGRTDASETPDRLVRHLQTSGYRNFLRFS